MLNFQFRLYPNKIQQENLWKHANKLNGLYNYFLNQRIESHKLSIKVSKYDQCKELISLKQKDQILNEIYSQVLQQVSLRLDKTYKNFFIKKKGFPKFRSCKNFFSICYPQSGYKLEKNYLTTKAYGKIKFNKHRKILGKIKQISITNKNNKFYLNVVTDYNKYKDSNNEAVGIDLGITNLAATSDNEVIRNCSHAKYFDKQINSLKSRRDLRNKKGSRKYKFLNKTIKKLYKLKSRKIRDFQHKISKKLSTKYDTIILEDLNLKKMSEGKVRGLNRELRNSSIGQFIQFLSYKTQKLIFVNPYNTSKTCNTCGKIHDLKLSDRTISCECGSIYDRDVNAAKNILCLGQALMNQGSSSVEDLTLQKILAKNKNSSPK